MKLVECHTYFDGTTESFEIEIPESFIVYEDAPSDTNTEETIS